MPAVSYPSTQNIPASAVVAVDTTAVNNTLYPVDTSLGVINITLPTYGSGATLTATLTLGVVTAVTVVAGGSGYTANAEITVVGANTTPAVLVPVVNALGVITSVTISSGGTGYAVAPALTVVPGSKVGDIVQISDAKMTFSGNKCVVKTGNAGHRLAGQVAGTDLDIVESGQFVSLRNLAVVGWTIAG